MGIGFFRRKHRTVNSARVLFVLFSLLVLARPLLPAETYYVAPTGKDTNTGASNRPFLTIQKAADIVNPGDTVIIRDGTYIGDSNLIVEMRRSGTSSQWITFKAENEWGAILDGRNNTTLQAINLIDGASYLRFEGLQIQGTISGAFSARENTHDIVYYRNLIHHIGRNCSDKSGGQVGFRDNVSSNRIVYDSNVLHTIGRLRPNEGCPSLFTDNYANHDHGMYLRGSNLTIVNNVFYNIRSGWSIQSAQGANNWLVANNTFAFANPDRDGHIVLWQTNDNIVIANNIFYEPRGAAIDLSPCAGKTNVVVRNNINTTSRMLSGGSCRGVSVGNNDTSTNPRLIGPEDGNFQLSSSSPAIDAADVSYSALVDHNGTPRPQGDGFDVGAFEYVDPSTVPPQVLITSPTPGASVSGDIVITAEVSDTDLLGVRFEINGQDIGDEEMASQSGEETTSEFDIAWNIDDLPNGLAVITTIARDKAGNVGTTSLVVSVEHPSSPTEPSGPANTEMLPRVRGR